MATEDSQTFGDSHSTGLAGRYATAAFDLALEEGALESVSSDLKSLKTMLSSSADLTRMVRSPAYSRDDQAKGMEAVLKQMGVNALTRRLVLLMVQKNRLFVLADVIKAFEGLVARQKGEVAAEVTSARPLSDSETAELKRVLKERLGRDASLTAYVDPKLLGGLKVRVGSRMIDSSLRTKLDQLRAAMKGN